MSAVAARPRTEARRALPVQAHPDMGGDPARFQRVSLAEAKLRAAGRL